MSENRTSSMDEMKQDATLKLESEAANRKAAASVQSLADATAAREQIEARRRAEAEEVAKVEAEEAEAEAEVKARQKAYEDSLETEAQARRQAETDADDARRLAEEVAALEIPAHERTLDERERTLGHDHPDTVAARARLEAARETAGRRKHRTVEQHKPESKPES
jgi:hypothetical protein